MIRNVLLVDDSPTLLLSVSQMLGAAGFGATQASSGASALVHLRQTTRIDLMITDLNMPLMDGIALIKETRRIAQRRFMPILMLTTESQQTKRDEARAAGATGWLVKPVGAADLLALLKKVIPGS